MVTGWAVTGWVVTGGTCDVTIQLHWCLHCLGVESTVYSPFWSTCPPPIFPSHPPCSPTFPPIFLLHPPTCCAITPPNADTNSRRVINPSRLASSAPKRPMTAACTGGGICSSTSELRWARAMSRVLINPSPVKSRRAKYARHWSRHVLTVKSSSRPVPRRTPDTRSLDWASQDALSKERRRSLDASSLLWNVWGGVEWGGEWEQGMCVASKGACTHNLASKLCTVYRPHAHNAPHNHHPSTQATQAHVRRAFTSSQRLHILQSTVATRLPPQRPPPLLFVLSTRWWYCNGWQHGTGSIKGACDGRPLQRGDAMVERLYRILDVTRYSKWGGAVDDVYQTRSLTGSIVKRLLIHTTTPSLQPGYRNKSPLPPTCGTSDNDCVSASSSDGACRPRAAQRVSPLSVL